MTTLVRVTITRYYGPDGKRCKSTTPGAKKVSKKSAKWYALLPGHKTKTPLATNKQRSAVLLAKLLEQHAHPEWERQRQRPIAEHLDDFDAHVRASPGRKQGQPPCEEYLTAVSRQVRRAVAAIGAETAGDLTTAAVQGHLAELARPQPPSELDRDGWTMTEMAKALGRDETVLYKAIERRGLAATGPKWKKRYPRETVLALWFLSPYRRGLGVSTIRDTVSRLKRFGEWLAQRCQWARNPLEELRAPTGEDYRHSRRALSGAELASLLESVGQSNRVHLGLTGTDRRALYLTALSTGFRRTELSVLRVASFDFAASTVTLPGSADKRGRQTVQPIPQTAAAEIRAYLDGKDPAALVWGSAWCPSAAVMLMRDLREAGVPYSIPGPDGLLFADFHALRHTFIALLDRSGLTLKQAMQLARHSDPRLTARIYGRADAAELAACAEKIQLPPMSKMVAQMVAEKVDIEPLQTDANQRNDKKQKSPNRARKPRKDKQIRDIE